MKNFLLLLTFMGFASGIFAQVSKTVNLAAAGTLSISLTSDELTTITNLTLTGILDVRDFKTMRDEMSLLTVLDLSGVAVAPYEGTAGTSPNSYDYPADAIPDCAFFNQSTWHSKISLISVVLPSSITSIGIDAFRHCSRLTTVTISSSVTSIGEGAFESCSGLITVDSENPNYSSLDGVLYNKAQTTLFQYPVSKIGSFTIPSSVTSIGGVAFRDCSESTDVTIPSSVTSIGEGAFWDCSGLITVDSNNPNYSSLDGLLYDKAQTKLIQCTISEVGSFTIPSSVTSIGDYAFRSCSGLTTVAIPSSVTSIGNYAFYYCSGLTDVAIPSSVASIGDFAFDMCSGLTSVTIPSSVNSIGYSAFKDCTGLTSITTSRITPLDLSLSTALFYKVNITSCTLNVPFGSKSAYQAADQWKDFINMVEMPGFHISTITVGIEAVPESTAAIDITSDIIWTAGSDQSWLTISPATGTGTGTFNLTAKGNPNSTIRTATVTVSAEGVESQTITVMQNFITGIDPIISDQQLTVYPNPTSGKVKLVFDQVPKGRTMLTVNDFTGKTILTQFIQNKEEWIDLKGNSPGVYLVRTNMKNFKVQKVILK